MVPVVTRMLGCSGADKGSKKRRSMWGLKALSLYLDSQWLGEGELFITDKIMVLSGIR